LVKVKKGENRSVCQSALSTWGGKKKVPGQPPESGGRLGKANNQQQQLKRKRKRCLINLLSLEVESEKNRRGVQHKGGRLVGKEKGIESKSIAGQAWGSLRDWVLGALSLEPKTTCGGKEEERLGYLLPKGGKKAHRRTYGKSKGHRGRRRKGRKPPDEGNFRREKREVQVLRKAKEHT